jgi:hypothetical protein
MKPKIQFRKPSCLTRRLAASVFAVLALNAAVAQASLPGAEVGTVSFVLGKAWITKPGQRRAEIAVGMDVGVYDRIDTESNGHVHVRLIDTALISVRPSSTLEIQRYDYNAADPEASAVKLNLIEGESRAISGEAAKKARQNFRLNTPVAAIGVRGTDFVAIANRSGIDEARVNEGTIIVAPFSSDCLADALGPCSGNGLELAYNYGANQIVQVSAGGDSVMLPISSSGLPESIVDQSLSRPQVASEGEKRGGELYTESVAALAVNPKLLVSRTPTTPEITQPVAPEEFTPDVAISAQALQQRQLMWGRWYERSGADERITVSTDLALGLADRTPVLGNDEYALFRLQDNLPRVQFGLGDIGFKLNSAQAFYRSNGATELLDVNGGLLRVDFNESTFATSLSMRGATVGAVNFSVSGRIDANSGLFNVVSPTGELAGFVTHDGAEAGYYFEKILETGTVDGLTLWGRQP